MIAQAEKAGRSVKPVTYAPEGSFTRGVGEDEPRASNQRNDRAVE